MSFLSADETVFNMNNNSWLTHIGANNLMSSSLHEFSASNNDELIETNNYSYWRPSAVHYVEFLIILLCTISVHTMFILLAIAVSSFDKPLDTLLNCPFLKQLLPYPE